ncbi:MAG: glycoside hydrolase family 31 protein [Planctomycetota bacterium]
MKDFRKGKNSLIWEKNNEIVSIESWGKNSLRVKATINSKILDEPHALLEPVKTNPKIIINSESSTIQNGKIKALITKEGRIQFLNSSTNQPLLEEEKPHVLIPHARILKSISSESYHIEQRFKAYEDERFYGLGQHRHGFLNQKGCVIELAQRNCEIAIPWFVSNRGYGFLWNLPSVGRVELGVNGTKWVARAAHQIDYWITIGDTLADIMGNYADVTGHTPLLPEWAAGFWQSRLRYSTQEELLSIAREYKKRGLPISVIVIDFFHWKEMGDWQFDSDCWPNPSAMVRELAEMGIKVMVSIWPTLHRSSVNFMEARERGLLVRNERGIPVHTPFSNPQLFSLQHVDVTNPEACDFMWDKVREGYYRHGIKIFWLDACEPEVYPPDHDNLRYYLGNGLEMGCIYPLMIQKSFYEKIKSEGEKDIITLCRSAWAGSQRYGAAVWSGDIESSFESLQAQVRAGLNIGLSGIPWWTTDIGGFFGGDIRTPYFRELIVRWFQYGVFCPLFRLHGERLPPVDPYSVGAPNEVWSFGEEAYEIIKKILFLRERLRPYIMKQMRVAHKKGIPPMRPLFFDFYEDKRCVDIDDQFLLGPDILVAPVLHQGERKRYVYLPAGTNWIDAWTNKKHKGGQHITADAPIDIIPVYLREGKNIPIKNLRSHI